MPEIPVNVTDLPTEYSTIDENLTYEIEIVKCELVGPDKNGNDYLSLQYEIMEPDDFAGKNAFDNYVGLPPAITPEMTGRERRKAQDSGVKLGQFCKCFKIKKLDTDEIVGLRGKAMLKNEEYEGKTTTKVKTYLI